MPCIMRISEQKSHVKCFPPVPQAYVNQPTALITNERRYHYQHSYQKFEPGIS